MTKEEEERLLMLVQQLNKLNTAAKEQFDNDTVADNYEPDFYNKVKPFADEVDKVAKEWKELVIRWIRETKPKYVHSLMIQNTYDNLTITSVQAFYKDTRANRFHKLIESIAYVLDGIKKELKKEG